ncbi:MAG: ShlB/FhaC/HecB family hemolysin secretion/activation protein, partial [Selenomonadaceae bacterium]|nr:ShlB/FhaC/HecB family hemolysin secretion/activation protein [Selenomonadaceae bacterium]
RNLKDIPGVNVNGVISPGTGQGESNLRVDLQKDTAGTYVIYAENYGSKAAGRYRYGLQADWKNLGGTGARLNVGGLISNSNQRGFNIAYETPVGHSMTTLGIGYSHSDYELGSVWSELGVEGKSDTVSLYGKTPLDNRSFRSANLVYGVNYRKLKDEFNGWDIGDRHSYSFNVGLEGTGRTARNALQYNLSLVTGNVIPDSDIADTIGTQGDTKGHFTKGTFDLTGVQQLSDSFDLMVKLSGQMAGHNLDSSEHIYLGGARGVRAYPQGEASGDAGLLGTVELRYHTKLPGLTLSLYYDAGNVKTDKNGNDSTTLKGCGIGVTYSKPNDWFARFDYARRIGFDEGLSDDADSRQRMWFLLGKMF